MTTSIYSEYYEKLFTLTTEQQQFLLSCYLEICRQQQWVPEVKDIELMTREKTPLA